MPKPGRPKSENPKSSKIEVRVTPAEHARIQTLALVYARGDLSKWIRYAALSVRPKMLK